MGQAVKVLCRQGLAARSSLRLPSKAPFYVEGSFRGSLSPAALLELVEHHGDEENRAAPVELLAAATMPQSLPPPGPALPNMPTRN